MNNRGKALPAPKLRFPEFRGARGWTASQLIDLTDVGLSNGVFNDPKKVGTGYKLINVGDMYIDTTIVEERLSLLTLSISDFEANQVKHGDIFFTRSSLVKSGIAVSNIYLGNSSDVTFDGHLIRFRANSRKVTPLFAHYLFKTTSVREQLVARGKSGTMTTIGQSDVGGVMLSYPEMNEQRRVADCLSALDELIAAQARKVDALKTHKKGLMQQLFPREGETQPRLRFPEFRNAGEWEGGLISDLATTVMGNAFPSTDFVENGTQVVRIGNLYQGELQLERAPVHLSDTQAEENSKFGVHPLDLLMSMTGTVGKRDYGFVIQVPPDCKPLLLNQRVMKLAPTVKCDPGFLLQLLKSDRLLDAIYSVPGGTKQANLSAQHIKDLSISYPPKSEQQRIGLCLSRLDAMLTLETQELETLKTHKKGLMQQLFPSSQEVAA